jgi:hypothetical protein
MGLQPSGETTGIGSGANGPTGDASDNLTVDFGFTPAFSLGNRVFADTNNNGIKDSGEAGISNVVMKLFAADGSGSPTGSVVTASATTDMNGYYRFDGLVTGRYVVVVDVAHSPALTHLASSTGNSTDVTIRRGGNPGGRSAADWRSDDRFRCGREWGVR